MEITLEWHQIIDTFPHECDGIITFINIILSCTFIFPNFSLLLENLNLYKNEIMTGVTMYKWREFTLITEGISM